MKHASIISKFLVFLCSTLVLSGCNLELKKGNLDSLSSYVDKNEEDVILLKPDILKLEEPEAPIPATRIQGHNLSLKNSVEIVYYVNPRNVQDTYTQGVLVWKNYREDETYTYANAEYRLTSSGKENISEEEYDVYYFNGLAAKELSKYVYAMSYVYDGEDYYYGALDRYSVLDYYRRMEDLGNLDTTQVEGGATLRAILNEIIAYGTTAQKYFGFNLNRLLNAEYFHLRLDYQGDYCGSLGGGFRDGYFTKSEDIKVYARDLPDHMHLAFMDLYGENDYHIQIGSSYVIGDDCISFKIDRDVTGTVTYMGNKYSLIAHLNDEEGNTLADDVLISYFEFNESLNLKSKLDKIKGYYLSSCVDWDNNNIESLTNFKYDYSGTGTPSITATFSKTSYCFFFNSGTDKVHLNFNYKAATIDEIYDGATMTLKRFFPVIDGGEGPYNDIVIIGWKLEDGTVVIDNDTPTDAFYNLVNVCGNESVEARFVPIYNKSISWFILAK